MATIAIIAERRHLQNLSIREAHGAFEDAGYSVDLVVPGDEQLFEIPDEPPPWEVALSRGRDLTGLALLAASCALGVLAINTPQSIELVRNKVAMQAVLLQHDLPLPKTWFAARPEMFRRVADEQFPLVVKPYDGDGAKGLWLLARPEDADRLPQLADDRSIYLAQTRLDTDGFDMKLYGIGSRVWAVRKPSPVRFHGPGPAEVRSTAGAQMVTLDPQLRDIALTCGRACGLDLWGVDAAMTPSGPVVIEVNDFPTYSAVPHAGALIADHVLGRLNIETVLRRVGRDKALSVIRSSQ